MLAPPRHDRVAKAKGSFAREETKALLDVWISPIPWKRLCYRGDSSAGEIPPRGAMWDWPAVPGEAASAVAVEILTSRTCTSRLAAEPVRAPVILAAPSPVAPQSAVHPARLPCAKGTMRASALADIVSHSWYGAVHRQPRKCEVTSPRDRRLHTGENIGRATIATTPQ